MDDVGVDSTESGESSTNNKADSGNSEMDVDEVTSTGRMKPSSGIKIEFKKPKFTLTKKPIEKFTKAAAENEIVKRDEEEPQTTSKSPAELIKEKNIPVPYKEPSWSGLPPKPYSFDVLKSGAIVENISLNEKPFIVFGRLANCDVVLAHPTISRFHAVLQYRSVGDDDHKPGYYIYDLGSTHGTFINKYKVKANCYARIQVGHMVKLGLSTRSFILQGPSDDVEPESDLTVTQLKDQRLKEKLASELAEKQRRSAEEMEEAQRRKKEEEEGVSWGMTEDADEETDLTENPFAASQNEELYISDPKKTLRGWFEREGYELEYKCEEKGYSQFLCRIELPIDNSLGAPMVAEALVRGKKKEAVVQCALEACRLLDQHGMLRQSNHESRKRKMKNWEADDFYDSDEDTFLDRTGTVERKRQTRMEQAGAKAAPEVHTYTKLMEKHKKLCEDIARVESELEEGESQSKDEMEDVETGDRKGEEEDALDAYMSTLAAKKKNKSKARPNSGRLRGDLAGLRAEEAAVRHLANIARPAGAPEVTAPQSRAAPAPEPAPRRSVNSRLPLFGKRKFGLKKLNIVKKDDSDFKKSAGNDEYESDSD